MTLPPLQPDAYALVRVPAEQVREGDRIGEGRFQGVVVVDVKYPVLERMAIGGIDPETVRISLGSHGWLGCRKGESVLVERATLASPQPADNAHTDGAT